MWGHNICFHKSQIIQKGLVEIVMPSRKHEILFRMGTLTVEATLSFHFCLPLDKAQLFRKRICPLEVLFSGKRKPLFARGFLVQRSKLKVATYFPFYKQENTWKCTCSPSSYCIQNGQNSIEFRPF